MSIVKIDDNQIIENEIVNTVPMVKVKLKSKPFVTEEWKILKRYIYTKDVVYKQSLFLYFDGVLGYREPTTGQFIFRDGIKEGL
jgi:hypothetical protein